MPLSSEAAAMSNATASGKFTAREVRRFLEDAGFAVFSTFANDYKPPRTVGLWVDYQNLTFDPFAPLTRAELFLLPPRLRWLGVALLRWLPWVVAGEVAVLARPR